MLLSEINPFIRFAQAVTVSNLGTKMVSYDSRLFYLCEGDCKLILNDKEYSLTDGSFLLWKCGTPYTFCSDKKLSIISINFDFSQKNYNVKKSLLPVLDDNFQPNKLLEKIDFADCETLNSPIILSDMQCIHQKIELILDEFSKKKIGYDMICSAMLKEIIAQVIRLSSLNIPENIQKIENVLRFIEKNYNKNITNSELSHIAGYHEYHLNRIMKNVTGITLHQYLINIRMEKAKESLLGTDLSISEISDLCGFKTPYHFASVFKIQIGTTPSNFRKLHKNYL